MQAERRFASLALSGLSPDSLGNYLASLGLLRVLSRRWPSTRIAWRNEVLQVVGGPAVLDELLDELMRIANDRAWTPYGREWKDAQARSSELAQKPKTKKESGAPFALWQAQAAENLLDGFSAHVVPHGDGRSMNPILGKAGIIGRRDFAKGWERAMDLLAPSKPSRASKSDKPARKTVREESDPDSVSAEISRKRTELKALLLAEPLSWLEKDLNGATWFSQANKLYNNGQRAHRDGYLSPWLMILACEGIVFLSGGSSRRLGARARSIGAFPFVTRGSAATSGGEAARDNAEFWAPVWERPMATSEVGVLFRRGRAELAARPAQTPAAFASSILRRGVDAGVTEFRRFVLGWTTAQDYVEPRFESVVATQRSDSLQGPALGRALDCITALIEHRGFPRDGKRFVGLRGLVESALLTLAAQPKDSQAGIALLDSVVAALDRIDRNRSFREGKLRWEPLPVEWLPSLFAEELPGVEARLALSLVSAFSVAQPFATYRFGVEWKYGRDFANYTHTERPPARWVWAPGELARVLVSVLSRRLLDQATKADEPDQGGRAPLPATGCHVLQWLSGALDESLFSAWLARLALFDWRGVPQDVRVLVRRAASSARTDGELAMLGLLQPLVDQRTLFIRDLSSEDLMSVEVGPRTTAAARSLVALIQSGNLDAALRLAGSRYAMAGARLATLDVPFATNHPDRLAAALLFTISDRERAGLFERWLRPRRRSQRGRHA